MAAIAAGAGAGAASAAGAAGASSGVEAALIGGGAGLLGDVMGMMGANKNNAFNAAAMQNAQEYNSYQATLARNFAAAQVAQQEKFQQSMFNQSTALANTAEQRRVADLKKAGINPLLAASTVGANVTGPMAGAAATGPSPTSPMASGTNPGAAFSNAGQIALGAEKVASEIQLNQSTSKAQEASAFKQDQEGLYLQSVENTPDGIQNRMGILENQYGLTKAEAANATEKLQLLFSTKDGIDLQNDQQRFLNSLSEMDVRQRAATINFAIAAENAVNKQQEGEAKNVTWLQNLPVIGKTITTAQAIATPVSSAAGAANAWTNANKPTILPRGASLIP